MPSLTQESTQDLLRRLGAGETIDGACAACGLPRGEFDAWWQAETAARVPPLGGSHSAPIAGRAEIARDALGIPHVLADSDDDLFFAFGYAMAQDRLWQLDYLRRRALGQLAEVLGPSAVELDLTARTVDFPGIARREVEALPEETARLLAVFSAGINAQMEAAERLPIEFDLLDYRPAPWSPLDSIAILGEFRYYLTVRFPVIGIPELARRALGEGPLYQAFLTPEEGDESILPRGSYPAAPGGEEPLPQVVGDPQEGQGSNNWVLAGSRTAGGAPLLASDPHIAFAAVSCWYEVHLCGGSFNVAGMAYAGVPGLLFGRNHRVAWGITNNICSQRDLYQERTDAAHPGCFLYDGSWEPARERRETIAVKGREPLEVTVRHSRNGPIVDDILPPPLRHTGPVSLRWLGTTPGDELTCMLAYDRARSADEFREALRGWRVPTFSVVFADADGHIGYQCAGRVPVRHGWQRAYRRGWEPADAWQGLIPFEGMPALADPPEGWIRTANNRTAPADYPYPLSGCWGPGYRARRIRSRLEEARGLARDDCRDLQQDALSLRAVEALPHLLRHLRGAVEGRELEAAELLEGWDGQMLPEAAAPLLFDAFFVHWTQAVVAERLERDAVEFAAPAVGGLAVRLLKEDDVGWFAGGDVSAHVAAAWQRMLDDLESRIGPDIAGWTWGSLHRLRLRHVLSGRGELGQLLDRHDAPVRGSYLTVCNTGSGPDFEVVAGANYRLIADLPEAGLWAVDAAGQSGHPGSPFYCNQLPTWLAGEYHFLPLDREAVEAGIDTRFALKASTA